MTSDARPHEWEGPCDWCEHWAIVGWTGGKIVDVLFVVNRCPKHMVYVEVYVVEGRVLPTLVKLTFLSFLGGNSLRQ
jgi:hypothetical protein